MKGCLIAAVLALVVLPSVSAAEFVPWKANFDLYTVGGDGSSVNGVDGWTVSNGGGIQVVDDAPGDRGKAFLITTAGANYNGTPQLVNSHLFQVEGNRNTDYPYSQVISFDMYFTKTTATLAPHYPTSSIYYFQVVVGQWALHTSWGNALVVHGQANNGAVIKQDALEFRNSKQTNQGFGPFLVDTWYHVELSYDLSENLGWMSVQDEAGNLWTSEKVKLDVGGSYNDLDFRFRGEGGASIWDGGTLTETVPVDFYLTNIGVRLLYPVPEPATMGLLGLGALALLRRRKTA